MSCLLQLNISTAITTITELSILFLYIFQNCFTVLFLFPLTDLILNIVFGHPYQKWYPFLSKKKKKTFSRFQFKSHKQLYNFKAAAIAINVAAAKATLQTTLATVAVDDIYLCCLLYIVVLALFFRLTQLEIKIWNIQLREVEKIFNGMKRKSTKNTKIKIKFIFNKSYMKLKLLQVHLVNLIY